MPKEKKKNPIVGLKHFNFNCTTKEEKALELATNNWLSLPAISDFSGVSFKTLYKLRNHEIDVDNLKGETLNKCSDAYDYIVALLRGGERYVK